MNDVLEQFKIVFNLDDKPLQDGLKKSETSLGEFGKKFLGIFATIASAGYIKKITEEFVTLNQELNRSTSIIGVNAGEAQALGNALQRFGGSTESAIGSLRTMSGLLEQAKKGQGALIEVARRYGISFDPMASASDTIASITKQMGKLTDQQRLAIGGQLGFDDAMIRASKDGGKALSELIKKQKELGVATAEDLQISEKLDNAQMDLKDMFSAITRDLVRLVIPSLTKLTELFTQFIDWIRKHKELVIGFFVGVAIAMAPVIAGFASMAIATATAFAPIIAVGATLASIALIAEDIYGYFMGWDTVTGDIAKQYPLIAEMLEGIRPLVEGINKTFEAIVAWLKDPSWNGFIEVFKTAGKALWDFLIQPFQAFGNYFENLIKKFSVLGDVFKNVGSELANSVSQPFDDFKKNFNSWTSEASSKVGSFFGFGGGGQAQVSPIPQVPQVPQQSSVINSNAQSNVNVNNNFNQNITTATPKQFADSTNQQIINSVNLQRQQQGALN